MALLGDKADRDSTISVGPLGGKGAEAYAPPQIRVSEAEARLDRREADQRDRVALGHVTVVELAEELTELVGMPDLRVVVLDLVRRQLADRLHLDLVDHDVEDVLPGAGARPDEDRDDHPLLVLRRLVAEPDRRRLAVRLELRLDDRRVEVQRV